MHSLLIHNQFLLDFYNWGWCNGCEFFGVVRGVRAQRCARHFFFVPLRGKNIEKKTQKQIKINIFS